MSDAKVNNQSSSPTRTWTTRIAYVFLSILALCLVTVFLAISPLGISLVVTQLNKQDGIQIEGVDGSFYSQIAAQKVRFENEQIALDVQQAKLDLDMLCLVYAEVCVSEISASNINIGLKPTTEPASTTPASNEYITLPLPISVSSLALGNVQLRQLDAKGEAHTLLNIDGLKSSIVAHQSFTIEQLSIASLTAYQSEQTQASPAGEGTQNTSESAFSLQDLANWQYQAIEIPQVFIPVNAEVKNSSIKSICIERSESTCINNTRIKAQLMEQKIQANVSLEPLNMPIAKLTLKASIDLAEQLAHDIEIELAPNAANTSKQAKPLQLSILGNQFNTHLALQNNAKQIATIVAELDVTQSSLPVKLEITLNDIQQLSAQWIPNSVLPISSINAKIEGTTRLYELDIEVSTLPSTLQIEASNIIAKASASLVDKNLQLKELSTNGELGDFRAESSHQLVNTSGQLGLKNQVDISFEAFKPMLLASTKKIDSADASSNQEAATTDKLLTATLSGQLALDALYTDDFISGSLLCQDIKGQVSQPTNASQAYDLSFLCDVSLAKNGWLDVSSFSVKQGENSIVGKGKMKLPSALNANNLTTRLTDFENTDSDFTLSIDLPNASSLYAPLKGNISGEMQVSGPVLNPSLNVSFEANVVQFQGFKLDRLLLNANTDIANNWQSSVNLHASGLYQKDLLAQNITLSGEGNMAQHQLGIALDHPDYGMAHSFSGALRTADIMQWKGKWDAGTWRLPFDQFILNEATPMAISANNSFIGAHCWVANKSPSQSSQNEFCINKAEYENAQAKLSADLDYDLANALQFYLPSMIQTGTKVPLRSDIDVSSDEKNGMSADIFNVITQANLNTTRHNIALSAIVANMRLDQQVLVSHVYAGTVESGAIGLSSSLQLAPDNRVHSGDLRIESLDVSPLLRFVPGAEKLAGIINGELGFEGPLDKPDVNGSLNISKGELIIDNYPYPFSNFNQTIDIVNNEAIIEGEFELGSGDAEYNAKAAFNDGVSISGNVRGAGMQIAYQNSELIASPDISFDVTPDNLVLKGSITIPNADIVIKELPKSAKSPSNDTIIIGKAVEPPVIPIGLDIDLNILLDVPKLKRVNIAALDLQASLAGDLQLRVRQQVNKTTQQYSPMQTYLNGSISLLSGKYEAYGQMLQVRSGDIYFSGPPTLPQFDISAIRNPLNTDDNVIAGVQISGNPIFPKVELFSEPDMIQARQLSYLLQGTDIDGGEGTSTNVQLVNALVNFGISSGGNQVNKLGKSIGFDSLNIQTAGQGENTQVQVTGRISDNIQVTYGVGLFDSVSEIILKYQLLPKLYIEAKNGADSTVDLFYELTRGDNM